MRGSAALRVIERPSDEEPSRSRETGGRLDDEQSPSCETGGRLDEEQSRLHEEVSRSREVKRWSELHAVTCPCPEACYMYAPFAPGDAVMTTVQISRVRSLLVALAAIGIAVATSACDWAYVGGPW